MAGFRSSRHSSSSSILSSLSGSSDPGDYTFGFSVSGVGLRQQSRPRHSLRPETSLPFNKDAGYDPEDLVSEVQHKFVEIPCENFPSRCDRGRQNSHLRLDGERYMNTTTRSTYEEWKISPMKKSKFGNSFVHLGFNEEEDKNDDDNSDNDSGPVHLNKNVGIQVSLIPERISGRRLISTITLGESNSDSSLGRKNFPE